MFAVHYDQKKSKKLEETPPEIPGEDPTSHPAAPQEAPQDKEEVEMREQTPREGLSPQP
jgi:hypothetical protein